MKYCPHCGENLELKNFEDRERLACSSDSCQYVFWNNPVPVVAAIVEYKGEVLLARNKAWPEKIFGLITGFLEKGETPETGVIREVKEELDLEGEIVEFIGNYSSFRMNQLIIAYHVSTHGDIKLGDELAEVKSVPIDKLRPWDFGTGHAVKDWLERREKNN